MMSESVGEDNAIIVRNAAEADVPPVVLAALDPSDPVGHPPRLTQLDGMRAIAIAMVIAQHSGMLSIGWAGVHLFFVLSGFLITGILRRARKDTHFWSPFYLKRVTRILPPLIPFFLLCSMEMSIPWRTTGWAYVLFGANIVQSLPHASITDLTILWSLAVEEHFYLLWPFAIRYLRRTTLIWLLVAVLVLDPILRAVATHHVASWMPIYFLTPFQLDGLGAGALLSILVEDGAWKQRLGGIALPAALACGVVFAACSRLSGFERGANSQLFNSLGYSLIVMASVLLLAHLFLRPDSYVSRLFSLWPMVFLGTISYGLYLYIGPVTHITQHILVAHGMTRGRINLLLGLIASITVSWVSFRFYESPITSLGRLQAKALAGVPKRLSTA